MSRKQSRELVFQRVYSLSYNDGRLPIAPTEGEITAQKELEFIESLFNAVENNLVIIDEKIRTLTQATIAFEKIYPVDLAILRMGVAEILYMDTPFPVVVNEAVDLAKRFSVAESVKFINGILGATTK